MATNLVDIGDIGEYTGSCELSGVNPNLEAACFCNPSYHFRHKTACTRACREINASKNRSTSICGTPPLPSLRRGQEIHSQCGQRRGCRDIIRAICIRALTWRKKHLYKEGEQSDGSSTNTTPQTCLCILRTFVKSVASNTPHCLNGINIIPYPI